MNRRQFIATNISLLTVSDTRTLNDDKSGDVLKTKIIDSGHFCMKEKLLKMML